MQRGRLFILLGILLALAAVGMMLVMGRDGGDEEPTVEGTRPVEEAVLPTPEPTPTPIPTDPAVVAMQDIPRGTHLVTGTVEFQRVGVVYMPLGTVPQEAYTSLDEVHGQVALRDIPRGSMLTKDMLIDEPVGSDAAALIPAGYVAIAIPVDHISSVGWSLRRGDHVDVLVSFLFVDVDEEFQTEIPNKSAAIVTADRGEDQELLMSETGMKVLQGELGRIELDPWGNPVNILPNELHQRPRLVSQVTVRDAMVLNVGPWGELFGALGETSVTPLVVSAEEEGQEVDGAAPADEEAPSEEEGAVPQQVEIIVPEGRELTEDEVIREYLNAAPRQPLVLVVSPQDALVLKWADEQGAAMHLALRSYADTGIRLPDTEAVTFQYMVDRFNIAMPPGLAYAVEPAAFQLQRTFLKLPEQLWNPWSTQQIEDQTAPPR